MRFPHLIAAWLLLTSWGSAATPAFLDQNPVLVDHWTSSSGLPSNAVNAIVQSPDGYLWLATFAGLVRFDGSEFRVFDHSSHPQLPGDRFVRLIHARGYLWLETEARQLVRRSDAGIFEVVDTELGLPSAQIRAWLDTPEGFFVGTFAGVARLREDGRFDNPFPDFSAPVAALARHPAGGIAAGTLNQGVYRLQPGSTAELLDSHGLHRITSLYGDDEGLAIGAKGGVAMLDARGLLAAHQPASPLWEGTQVGRSDRFFAYFDDSILEWEDSRWIKRNTLSKGAINRGRLRWQPADGPLWRNEIDKLWRDEQLVLAVPDDRISDFLIDANGQAWVALAEGGLVRIRPRPIVAIGAEQGLQPDNVYSVIEDQGRLLVGSQESGLHLVELANEVPELRQLDLPTSAQLLHRDRQGRLWIGGTRACEWRNDRCLEDPDLMALLEGQTARSLLEDSDGGIWLGADRGLAHRPANGQWRFLKPPWRKQFASIRAALETPDGRLWFASNGEGIGIWYQGQFEQQISVEQGLGSERVRTLWFDASANAVWAGTEDGGLCRIQRLPSLVVRCLGRRQGLWADGIHKLLADDHGRLWMSSNRGLFWAKLTSLHAVADGLADWVIGMAYDQNDGMPSAEANGGSQSAGTRSSDGWLWFPTQAGLVGLDPDRVERAVPVSAQIDEVRIAGESSWLPAAVALGTENRNLEIHFSAPLLSNAKRVRFRYRMLGLDDDWIDADGPRLVNLASLPAGELSFQVEASDTHGAWSGHPVSLPVMVQPRFVETLWFPWLLAASGLLTAALLFTAHLRRSARRQRELQQAVTQKTAELSAALTETSAQKQQLEAAADARGRLFASISHELRTPLSLILGPLEERSRQLRAASAEDDQMVLRNARRLKRMVDQILDLERVESGKLELNLETLDLAAMAAAVAESFQFLAESRGIAWRVECTQPCLIRVDREQFEKVIINLCSNAIKFTPEGGTVVIRVSPGPQMAQLTVEDSGPGIPAELRAEAFSRFSRLKRDAAIEGTGIGLSLASELVTLHQGSVTVDDSPELGGARFLVCVPMANADAPGNASTGGGQTVLIVDDNSDMRRYLRSILERHFVVMEAADGVDGLRQAREHLPDLIVSDIMMPGMDGIGFIRELRADGDTNAIPTLFLTARGGDSDEISALNSGGDQYLAKPFDSEVLLARLQAMLAIRARFARSAPTATLKRSTKPLQQRIQEFVLAHLDQPEIGVEELARALNISRSALFRQLKAESDQTPTDLIRELRLSVAAQWLQDHTANVTEIAYAAGFGSLSSFGRAFRSYFGCSPSDYRERHKGQTSNAPAAG